MTTTEEREAYAKKITQKLSWSVADAVGSVNGLATWQPAWLYVEIPSRRFIAAVDSFVTTGEGREDMINRGKDLLDAWKEAAQKFTEKTK